MKLQWKRVRPGRQETLCGRYAVETDGYSPGYVRDAGQTGTPQEVYDTNGVIGGEWAAIDRTRNDDNLDWFKTMKEAKAECQRHADINEEPHRWGLQ